MVQPSSVIEKIKVKTKMAANQQIVFSIAKQFSKTPGPRTSNLGPYSAEELRETLDDLVRDAIEKHVKIIIDLDGTKGFGTSFLEHIFGGLVRKFGYEPIKRTIAIKSDELPLYRERSRQYLDDAGKSLK